MNRKEAFLSNLAQTSDDPYGIHIERAEGSHVWDKTGKKYIDFVAGIAVANVGHRHPRILEAIERQSRKYLHSMVYGEYIQDEQIELASALHKLLPEHLNNTYLVNSGTEANEAAIKLAKRFTGRRIICSFRRSYHGSTQGSLSVSGNEEKKYAYRPLLSGIRFLDLNDESQLGEIDNEVAAVIMEVIQGDAGVRKADADFLRALRKRCDDSGALLIMDEIQTGMGRTGKMFAFEHDGAYPDILTLAKSLGGGLPIGSMTANRNVMSSFRHDPPLGHITTFGGNPLSASTALEVIQIIREEGLLEQATIKGKLLKELLNHSKIAEVRQYGLMIAVDLESKERLSRLIKNTSEKGLIIYRFLSNPTSFRISPPLNISDDDIHKGCEIILNALDGS